MTLINSVAMCIMCNSGQPRAFMTALMTALTWPLLHVMQLHIALCSWGQINAKAYL